ncbi:P-loop containing nucleoside triphosphate hydrolase protein, partial [Pisolithus thermaeus]
MGPTASGKTTFIDYAAGRSDVDRGSTSCTTEVLPVRYPHSDGVRNIVLVDTPGCNNGFMTDFQLLGIIAEWLNSMQNIKLNGILYFHRISDYRMRDASSRSYKMLRDLCGNDNCKNVIFVTTMWDKVSEEVGSEREQELRAVSWGTMVNLGSTTHRFEGTAESAWKIIDSL